MVRKIQNDEYLKRYDNMTSGECRAYEERVGEWLRKHAEALLEKGTSFEAQLQNVLQVSGGWNDEECQGFEEGVKLLSAHVNTGETWLPDMLYTKSAKRVIRKIVETLQAAVTPKDTKETSDENKEDTKAKEEPAEGTGMATQAVAPFPESAGDGDIAGGDHKGEAEVKAAPARPKHIDQYIHLLPQKAQERAAQVKDLYRELDTAREKMRLLMDDETASPADREAWAKKATGTDTKIRKILDEIDSEWDKLVKEGRVVVDDLGNARVVETGKKEPENGNPSDDAEKQEAEPAELTSEQRARRRELRKWLVDTRRGNGDKREEHVAKWKEGFREFLAFDGDAAFVDEKIKAAAEHYGISLEELKTKEP